MVLLSNQISRRALSMSIKRRGVADFRGYRMQGVPPIAYQRAYEFYLPRAVVTYFVWTWYHHMHATLNHNRGYIMPSMVTNKQLGIPEYEELLEIAARIRAGEDDKEMFPPINAFENKLENGWKPEGETVEAIAAEVEAVAEATDVAVKEAEFIVASSQAKLPEFDDEEEE